MTRPDQTEYHQNHITQVLQRPSIYRKCIAIQYDVLMVRSNGHHYGMAIHGLPVLVSTAHAQSPVAVSMLSA